MHKLLKTILIGVIISSCSNHTLKSQSDEKVHQLFTGVLLDQKELLILLDEFEIAANGNSNSEALEVAKNYIKENDYNERLTTYAKSLSSYKEFEKEYLKFSDTPLSRKMELLRVKNLDKDDYLKYIDSFNLIKDAPKRFDLTEQLITNDFPHYHYADFYGRIALMLSRPDNNYKKRIAYETIVSNVKITTLKLNLYIFQKIPTADLEEIVKVQAQKNYKKARAFIEGVQEQTNKDYLSGLTKKFEEKGIKKIDFSKIIY